MAVLTRQAFKSSHWYTRDGAPMHRVPTADGTGDRAATVKDARRLGLLPSVTGILSVLDKPALGKWKCDQVALAALRTPKSPDESEGYWCERVCDAAFRQVDDAADLGSKIHAALESAFADLPWDASLSAYVVPVIAWKQKTGITVIEREKVLVNAAHGFAGTTDVLFRWGANGIGILDYKTKKTKPGEAVKTYEEHSMQLAAYAATYWGEAELGRVLAANIFISSTEPGRMEVCKSGDLPAHFEAFKACAAIWRYQKGYDPREVR